MFIWFGGIAQMIVLEIAPPWCPLPSPLNEVQQWRNASRSVLCECRIALSHFVFLYFYKKKTMIVYNNSDSDVIFLSAQRWYACARVVCRWMTMVSQRLVTCVLKMLRLRVVCEPWSYCLNGVFFLLFSVSHWRERVSRRLLMRSRSGLLCRRIFNFTFFS